MLGSAVAILLSQSLWLLSSVGWKPAIVALGQEIHSLHASYAAFPNARTGLSGLEVENVRTRLAGVSEIVPYRVYEAEIQMDGKKRHVVAMGFGLTGTSVGPLLFGGSVPSKGVCIMQPAEQIGKTILVDGEPCEIAKGVWNDSALRFLSGRQRVELVRLIDSREAYKHPENRIYEALVIGKKAAQILNNLPLQRGSQARLTVVAMADWFWRAQGPLIVLLICLACAVILGGCVAMIGLGLAERANQKHNDWIRSALGETFWGRCNRNVRFALSLLLLILTALVVTRKSETPAGSALIAVGFSLAWLAGRSLVSGNFQAHRLMLAGTWIQVATCSAMLFTTTVAQRQLELASTSQDALRFKGLYSMRLRITDPNSAVERWIPELQQNTLRDRELAFIWPLPMEPGVPIEIEQIPSRFYWTSPKALRSLRLGCTDLSDVPAGRLRQGILLSENLAKAIGPDNARVGRKLNFLNFTKEILGTCRDNEANPYLAAYIFEPVNLLHLIVDKQEKDVLLTRTWTGLWQAEGSPLELSEVWKNMWLPESDRSRLITALGVLAASVAVLGLAATSLLLVARSQPEMALRLALGAERFNVLPRDFWRALQAVLSANGLVLGIGTIYCLTLLDVTMSLFAWSFIMILAEMTLVAALFGLAGLRLSQGTSVMRLLRVSPQ
jgi:hypothetical protein